MPVMASMRRVWWRLYFAAPGQFQNPGYYLAAFGKNIRILPLPVAQLDLVEFPEQTLVYAKDQPEYRPLPAYKDARDPQGRIVCCWQLNGYARLRVLFTGRVWHTVLTFNQALQPQLLEVDKPGMPPL